MHLYPQVVDGCAHIYYAWSACGCAHVCKCLCVCVHAEGNIKFAIFIASYGTTVQSHQEEKRPVNWSVGRRPMF